MALEIKGPPTARVLTIDHIRYHLRDTRRDADGVVRARCQAFRDPKYEALWERLLGKVDG